MIYLLQTFVGSLVIFMLGDIEAPEEGIPRAGGVFV